jgi:hypothetical protein
MLVNSTRKAFSKKAFIALLIISNLFGCKSPDNGETASTNGDSLSDTDSLSVSPVYDEEGPEKPDNFIQYDGVAEDENWTAMQAFPLLSTIFTLSRKTIDLKDSLENVQPTRRILRILQRKTVPYMHRQSLQPTMPFSNTYKQWPPG